MGKVRRSHGPKKTIPLLAAAIVCENILTETENVQSAIRIVDHVTLPHAGAPTKGMGIQLPLMLFLAFKVGDNSGGEREMTWELVSPSGKKNELKPMTLHFAKDTPNAGYTIRANVVLKYEKEGVYWYNIYVEGSLITRIPIKVSIAPKQEASS